MSTLHELEAASGEDLATHDYWARARTREILRWVDAIDPETVGDIGCGSGYLTAAIAERGYDAVGVDIDPELIDVAQNRQTAAVFEVGDATDLRWPTSSMDCLIYADVIEHFDDPATVLEEARRVLMPDGELICSLPAFRLLYGPHDEHQDHFDRYNRRRLRTLATRAGFDIRKTRFTNTVPLAPYFVTQRVLRRDVPSGVRGQANAAVEWVKSRLLDLEGWLDVPAGVTLLARLTPRPKPPVRELSTLVMNYEWPPRCGGGGVFSNDLKAGLTRRGHDVPVVTRGEGSADRENSVWNLAQFPIRSLPALVGSIRRHEPDVINAHFSLPTAAALPAVSRLTSTPYVVNVMGADLYDPTRYHRVRPAMDLLNEHAVFRGASRVIVPSSDMYDRLPKAAKLKAHVIPYFVDPDDYATGLRECHDPTRLLTVARLVPRKNLVRTAEAVAKAASDRELHWSIVGSGSQRERIGSAVEQHDIADVVTFHGYVPDDDLRSLYANHDAFVLVSKHEAFGIVYLEAMASGLPVVAADVGGQTDVITDDVSVCVDHTDATAIADGIKRVCDEHDRLSANARERVVNNYTEEHVIPRYERIFAEVADA